MGEVGQGAEVVESADVGTTVFVDGDDPVRDGIIECRLLGSTASDGTEQGPRRTAHPVVGVCGHRTLRVVPERPGQPVGTDPQGG